MNNIIIGSEANGFWGKIPIEYALKYLYPNINITYKNNKSCNFIIRSIFVTHEKPWNKIKKPYIFWTSESRPINDFGNYYNSDYLYLTNCLDDLKDERFIYYPFCLDSPYLKNLYKNIKLKNSDKYFLAYCARSETKLRNDLYNIFVNKKQKRVCYALSTACGNYPETKTNIKIKGGWDSNDLVKSYSEYTFVFALENSKINGYITEKILNAFYSGAIPIYWGSHNINDFFNKNAFINVDDFNSLEECVDYVINLDKNEIKKIRNEKIFNDNCDVIHIYDNSYKNNKYKTIFLNKFKTFFDKTL